MDTRPALDERFMRRAVAISRRGFPAPNPHVGCVIARNGEIVGEGYHAYTGGPHAEVVALRKSGERARGADVYVTLEPCRHYGRTPPCTNALIEAGVGRVVVAVLDPTAAGGGLDILRQAGVQTAHGMLAKEAIPANVRWLTAVGRQRPHVTVKAAMSLDGRIALPDGQSKWITGPRARQAGRRLRAEAGAVLVGRRTVALDDPELTARIPGVRNPPVRIVLDPHRRLKGQERVFNDRAPTRWITGEIHLPTVLDDMFGEGIRGLLVEGGATTIAAFFREGLVDAVELFVAPKLLGDGPAWIGGLALPSLDLAPKLEITRVRKLGDDLQISARPA